MLCNTFAGADSLLQLTDAFPVGFPGVRARRAQSPEAKRNCGDGRPHPCPQLAAHSAPETLVLTPTCDRSTAEARPEGSSEGNKVDHGRSKAWFQAKVRNADALEIKERPFALRKTCILVS